MFEPRIKTSSNHKPQNIPAELLKMIKEVFSQKHASFLENKELIAEGAIYPEEILVLVGFKNKESIRQFNFECSMDYSEKDVGLDIIHKCIDAIDSMMSEYVENYKELSDDSESVDESQGIEFPRNWSEFDFNKSKVFLKTSATNTEIERLTEAFLLENEARIEANLEENGQDLH